MDILDSKQPLQQKLEMLNEPSDSETDELPTGKLKKAFQSGILAQQVQRLSINSAGMIPFSSASIPGGYGTQPFQVD